MIINTWHVFDVSPWLIAMLAMALGAALVWLAFDLGMVQIGKWQRSGLLAEDAFPENKSKPVKRLILVVAGAASGLVLCWIWGPVPAVFPGVVLMGILIALAWIDAETGYLPDLLTIPLLWLGLLVNLDETFVRLSEGVLGAVTGYMVFWLLAWGFRKVTGRDGLGNGDFKLLAAIGAWLGIQMLPQVLLVASSSALIAVAIFRLAGLLKAGQSISFGPYLALGGAVGLISL